MHHILVVHGTWNPPDQARRMWYQLDPSDATNFCRQLNDALTRQRLEEIAWPSSSGPIGEFSWTGDNTHTARLEGARRLADLMVTLGRSDPGGRIHLIGHSHGGNVALKAIELLFHRATAEGRRLFVDALLGGANDVTGAVNAALERTSVNDSDAFRAMARPILEDAVRVGAPLLADDALFQLASRRGPRWATARIEFMLIGNSPLTKPYQDFVSRWWRTVGPASVTFMGTPFYRKVWKRERRIAQALRRLPGTAVALALLSGPFVYLCIMLYGALLALLPQVGMLSWNPLAWPLWLRILGLILVIVVVALSALEPDKRDTNLYFDQLKLGKWDPVPIPTLVLSAGRLDEALMALSAEPFAFALLVPQLRALLARETRWSLSADPTGREDTFSGMGDSILRWLAQAIGNLGYGLLAPVWIPIRRWWVAPLLTDVLLKTVNASAFGLPPHELSSARVAVGSRPHLAKWFDETYRDVAELLLRTPPLSTSVARAESAANRYEFLTNDALLAGKQRTSLVWDKLQASVDGLRRRYAEPGSTTFERDLALDVLALEERIKELAGNVDLNHSWYYSNREVIEMIARFIANGTPDVDGVV